MASINMCDRCGAIGLEGAIGTLVYHTAPTSMTHKLELCPTCMGSLVEWVGDATPSDQRTPFREPWRAPKAQIETGE